MSESDAAPFVLPDGIMAMTQDDGIVVTLLRMDDEFGAIFRQDGEWVPLTDPTAIEGQAFVGVTDDAVDLFDEHEAEGYRIQIRHYPPSPDGPFWPTPFLVDDEELLLDEETGEYYRAGESENPEEPEAPEDAESVEEDTEEEEEPLAASIALNSASDLDIAIAAAMQNQDLRWYVERRVAALGLEADLPWQKD